MEQVILAVDPGSGGALAWITGDGHLIEVADMPIIDVMTNGKMRRRISATQLADMFARRAISRVITERVIAMPRKADGNAITMGAVSASASARCAGLLEGIAAAMTIPYEEVMPHIWKKRAGVPKDKGGARQMAQRLWPGAAKQFSRVRDDGRAEASLLGRWAANGLAMPPR